MGSRSAPSLLFFGKCFQASEGKCGKDWVPDTILLKGTPEGGPHSGFLLRAVVTVIMGEGVRSWRHHGWRLTLYVDSSSGGETPISFVVWVDDVLIFTHGGECALHVVRTFEQGISF